jgi:hypothetical protein
MYASPSVIKIIMSRKIGCSRHGENMNAYRILVKKPEVKRPLRKSKCRWEDNTKMYLREIEDGVVWTGFICL